VQVDSVKTRVESAWFQRLRLKCDKPLSNVAFNFNLRRYSAVAAVEAQLATERGRAAAAEAMLGSERERARQGPRLVHFSARPEIILTQKPPNTSGRKCSH
jgi:hypothetical protein